MRWTTGCASLLLFATAACGGGSGDSGGLEGDEKDAAAAISTYFEGEGMQATEASCIGDGLVRQFGIAHLKDLGVLDEKLKPQPGKTRELKAFSSAADAPKAATITVDCVTVAGVMKEQYQGIDDATADCLAKAFGRQRMIDSMAAGLQGLAADDTPAEVTAEMSKCVPDKK